MGGEHLKVVLTKKKEKEKKGSVFFLVSLFLREMDCVFLKSASWLIRASYKDGVLEHEPKACAAVKGTQIMVGTRKLRFAIKLVKVSFFLFSKNFENCLT